MTTATTTPQINDLIGWKRKNYRAGRCGMLFGAMFSTSFPGSFIFPRSFPCSLWGGETKDPGNEVAMLWGRLLNGDVRQREPPPANLSFFAISWKPFVPSKRYFVQLRQFCTTWSTWNNRKTLNLTQSSMILTQHFRCSSRRSFLNSPIVI